MTGIEGAVFIAGLSFISGWFFLILYYGDRFHARRLREREMLAGVSERERELLIGLIQSPEVAAREREMLLQRIQAPQTAVDQHVIREAQPQTRMTPRWDDDAEMSTLLNGESLGLGFDIGLDPMGTE